MDAVIWSHDAVRAAATLDDLTALLRDRRVHAGSPSFSELARRVSDVRAARGVRASERSPGRITVYDCFRSGRRRVDVELVLDIVRALGGDEAEVGHWRESCAAVLRRDAAGVVPARRDDLTVAAAFTGRGGEVAAVRRAIGPVLITGMPGSGKTQVATRALRELVDAGRIAGVVSVDLRASDTSAWQSSATAMLDAVAVALGSEADPDAELSERAEHVADLLSRQNTGLVVDDIAAWEQVAALAERVVATPLVLVSRSLLDTPPAVQLVELAPWSPQEGLDYLRAIVGAARVDAEPEAAADLVTLAGGLPLAAALTAARIHARTHWTLAEHRDAQRARLDSLRLDDPVSDSIALTAGMLRPEALRALRLLAVLPCDGIPEELLGALLDVDDAAAAEIFRELAASHCAERHEGSVAGPRWRRIGLHALVRAYGAAASWDDDPQGVRDAALDRLADAYLERARGAAEAIHPGHAASYPHTPAPTASFDPLDGERWLAAERVSLMLLAEALEDRRPEVTVRTAQALSRHLDVQGLLPLALRLQSRSQELAQVLGDPIDIAIAAHAVAQLRMRLRHEGAVAELERAAALAAQLPLPRLSASATNALAVAAVHAGDLETGLRHFESVLEIAQTRGIPEYVGPSLDNIAIVMRQLGDIEGSIVRHREAYELAVAQGHARNAASALSNLSDDQLAAGDIDGAVESAARAVELTADSRGETHAYALTNLGLALSAQGHAADAIAHHRRALEVSEEMSDPVLRMAIHINLGLALREAGDAAAAARALEAGLALATDSAHERGRGLLGLAELAADAGDAAAAAVHAEAALGALPEGSSPERTRAEQLRRPPH
ncbi:tetratricopeptide repeat protein [Microbacterium sp.]|uniref:tetratricopeptide repeat protein n=1 Tax=Microbacterium sp. TaxID=51671 RepID=UPI0039E5C774